MTTTKPGSHINLEKESMLSHCHMIFNKAKGHRDQNQTKALFKYKPDVTSMLSDLTKCLLIKQ